MPTRAQRLEQKKKAAALGDEPVERATLWLSARESGMTLEQLQPDELGYSRRQLSVLLLAEFDAWMFGQTVGMSAEGAARYYPRDVRSFIGQIRRLIVAGQRGVTD